MAGLALPLLGLIASHLRSVQSKQQIETQQEQNKFSNYLAHREQFNTFFSEDKPLDDLSNISKWQIYGRLFPNAQEADFRVTSSLHKLFAEIPNKLHSLGLSLGETCHHQQRKKQRILNDLRPLEIEFERISGFHFGENTLPSNRPLGNVEKSLLWQKTLTIKLYDCCNFHREEMKVEDLWQCEMSYKECLKLVSDKAFQEKLLQLLRQISELTHEEKEKNKELTGDLRGLLRYESERRTSSEKDNHFLKLLIEVLEANFPEEKHQHLLHFFPPEQKIWVGFIRDEEKDAKPASDDPNSNENSE